MSDGPGRLRGAQHCGLMVEFSFAGQRIEAREGETIAAALWARGVRSTRRSTARGEWRGPYCCMGICYECLVLVDGREVRACTTAVRDGIDVQVAE